MALEWNNTLNSSQQQNWLLDDFQVPEAEDKTRFHDLDLPDQVMQAVAALGYKYCSPIQALTLPESLDGKDITGKAQTGSGKTAAFLLSMITDFLDFPIQGPRRFGTPRALIIAPTRELVMQIASDAEDLTRFCDVNVQQLVGGMDFEAQQKQLKQKPTDIMVATPGRLLDFCRRGHVNLREVEVVVLDEADRMLSMGFIPDVRAIIRQTPKKEDRQTLLFSATFSDQILRLAEQWTFEPVHVEIESDDLANESVEQKFFSVARSDKYKVLLNSLKTMDVKRAIVFANRRHITRDLAEKLQKDGIRSALLSGEVAQAKRVKTLERFRSGDTPVLVATDVAGRGIHVDGVSHVFNYDLPEELEDYVHRIGRTGRAGATGTSISFASEDDAFLMPELEELLGKRLNCEPTPSELLV
ncbi:MAG: DEAD/DEAH box helicase [Oceanospirillaceae bacterium]|jgi:ATP-dependent RNA helicase RhlB|nr:DEAD/DEAH box helicase [Oceanospirillaceae bacterium]MBT4443391.1 DEAD/DEAH box helicase [Oceanospirillaceae bacterium]MBT6078626.1 DEAD/DEAH box helicase [Oceanospirillaceae bacterium]MBT7331151.1 DEAD/DEAH box helicase [Oceanospirillaceae bacterium]